MSVPITGDKIHTAIYTTRILPQDRFDCTSSFSEIAPIDGSKHSQAADTVRNRNLISRLLLIAGLHQLLDRAI